MTANKTPEYESIIACDPRALTTQEMERWSKVIVPQLYAAVQQIQQLPDGYAWRLPGTPETLMLLAEDLAMERQCCPFIRFTLEMEPDRGPLWLKMTGGKGVKEFLQMTFEEINLFDQKVSLAAGFGGAGSAATISVDETLESIEAINERFATEGITRSPGKES